MRKEDNQGGFLQETRQFVGLISWIAAITGAWLEVWLRRPGTWGERYCGPHMAMGIIALFLVPPLLEPLPRSPPSQPQNFPNTRSTDQSFGAPPGWTLNPGMPQASPKPASPVVNPVGAMLIAAVATVAMLLVHRVKGVQLRWRGYVTHSLYSGAPWLRGNEARVKTTYEPALCLLVGGLLMTVSVGLGIYAIVGGVGLSLTAAFQEEAAKARRRRMRDAMLEQQHHTRDWGN